VRPVAQEHSRIVGAPSSNQDASAVLMGGHAVSHGQRSGAVVVPMGELWDSRRRQFCDKEGALLEVTEFSLKEGTRFMLPEELILKEEPRRSGGGLLEHHRLLKIM
jgi:hypothetical protein